MGALLGAGPLVAWALAVPALLAGSAARSGLERLCRYGLRSAVALARLEWLDDAHLRYRLKRRFADGSTAIVLTPEQLLRRLAVLVPPPRVHAIRYHGLFAPHARARPALTATRRSPRPPRGRPIDAPASPVHQPAPDASAPPPSGEPPPPGSCGPPGTPLSGSPQPLAPPPAATHPRRLPWAELLRRVHALDVLDCRRCHGRLHIIASLTDPAVTSAILRHLALPANAPRPAPARSPPAAGSLPEHTGGSDDAFVDPPCPD